MREIWLKANRRALYFGMVLPLLMLGLGVALAGRAATPELAWFKWLGIALSSVGGILVGVLGTQLFRPRVAYQDGQVLFYLRT